MKKTKYDRSSQDVGNILNLEHINVTVPDQSVATFFYVSGLGFTRDPYVDFGPFNTWINVGNQQFHLPVSEPQVLRGHVGVVVPNLTELSERLERISKRLVATRFKYRKKKSMVEVTCPWGNKIHCYAAGSFGSLTLGIPYVEFKVGPKSARGISLFYQQILEAPTRIIKNAEGVCCEVKVGQAQTIRFRESDQDLPAYDGHHIAIYLVNFSRPYQILKKHKLISMESNANEYRFQKIINPDSGKVLFEIEHEVRSLLHPMYARPLINRNANQSLVNYRPGRDQHMS